MKITVKILMISVCFLTNQSFGQIAFQKNFGADSTADYGQSVVQVVDSGYYVVGVRVSGSSIPFVGEGILKRTDKYGNEIWTNYYSAPGSNDLTFGHIEKTSDNNLIITGVVTYSGNYDVYLTKIDTIGNILWYKTYGGPCRQRGLQVKQTFDNGFIIGGWNETFCTATSSFYLIKTNSFGDTIWTRAYPNSLQQYGYAVEQTPDSGYVIVGNIQQPMQVGTDMYVIKTNANGDTLWTKIIDYSGTGEARDVKISNSGNIIISGWISPTGCADPILVELDQNGNILWLQTYDSGLCEWNYSLCKTNDNGFAIFGMDGSSDYYLVKTDSVGNQQWLKKFNESSTDYGYNVRQTFDGGFIMTGITSDTNTNIILIKTDSVGNILSTINEVNYTDNFLVFPNPFSTQTTLQTDNLLHNATLTVYNSHGQTVKQIKNISGQTVTISRDNLPSGLYFLRLSQENKIFTTAKLVITDNY